MAYERGELENAERLCRDALQHGLPSTDLLNQLGRSLLDQGRAEEAIEILRQAIQLPRSTSESHYLLGQACLQSGQYSKARESFQQAVKLLPDHTQAFFGLYTASMRLGDAEAAERYREQFLQLEAIDRRTLTDRSAQEDTLTGLPFVRATVARTFFGAGQIYRFHDQPGKAIDLFRRAAGLDAETPVYGAALEALYVQRNALSDGVIAFQQLASEQPRSPWNHFFLGRLHDRLKQVDAAEQAYGRAQQLAPTWAESYRALADLYLRANRKPAEALALARKAAELEPNGSHYHLLAVACIRNHDRAAARAAMEQAVALNPNETRYRAFLDELNQEPQK
jgi:tetratricopeptide (TPR) repeat protein